MADFNWAKAAGFVLVVGFLPISVITGALFLTFENLYGGKKRRFGQE
jgi:hypothetical protein